MLDSQQEMEVFTRFIANDPAVGHAVLMIDSSDWQTVLAGLKNAQGKCIVNSISLKGGEQAFLEKARELRRLGAAVVVMAFDEEGQATTYERKTASRTSSSMSIFYRSEQASANTPTMAATSSKP